MMVPPATGFGGLYQGRVTTCVTFTPSCHSHLSATLDFCNSAAAAAVLQKTVMKRLTGVWETAEKKAGEEQRRLGLHVRSTPTES